MIGVRRLLTWYLPLASGIVLSLFFAWGFARGVAGTAGEVVRESPVSSRVVSEGGSSGSAREEQSGIRLIVIVGDSLARGTGDELGEGIGGRLSQVLDDRGVEHEIANLGVDGAKTTDLLARLERPSIERLFAEASAVVVSIGGNDLFGERESFGVARTVPDGHDTVIEPIQTRIFEVVAGIREENPEAPIFLLGLYNPFASVPDGERLSPVVTRWNAALLQRFADDPRVVIVQTSDLFLDHDRLSADRFHPNGDAYALIARRISDAL